MFYFGCGLVGHNIENCRNPHIPYEGGTNPRGAWLRTRIFGKKIIERLEKTFRSNPLKSISGLLDKMAAVHINKQEGNLHRQGNNTNSHSNASTHRQNQAYRSNQMTQNLTEATTITYQTHQHNMESDLKNMKRKLEYTTTGSFDMDIQEGKLAGLANKASQKPRKIYLGTAEG